jgi:tRNA dimethylallyltransferase
MSGIGYKELGEYLNKKISKEEAIQKIKYRTHQYVRRQDTWFLRDGRIKWIKNRETEKIIM